MSSVIICDNLKFAYDQKPILDRVNLKIPTGDFVSVVGRE